MQLTGDQIQRIVKALMSAFNPVSLKRMVRYQLNKTLTDFVEEGPLEAMAFGLVEEWEKRGRIDELIKAARKANQGNELLQEVEEEISKLQQLAALPRAASGQSDPVSAADPSVVTSRTAPALHEESNLSISEQADSDPETIAPEEEPEILFEGPCYALVIGINYRPDNPNDKGPNAPRFPILEYAEKDARDFVRFLKGSGFPEENIHTLFGSQALRDKITDEFDWLGNKCRESADKNPLVIVYFSGHGWTDKGKHYLIPYNANPDKLLSSAFSNSSFNECLSLQETNRLVVFLDACHAGAFEPEAAAEGAQKGATVSYDAYSDLSTGQGRFLIASCGPGQKSHEWKKMQNSIFTYHLLDLLKCKGDDLDKEEIDAFDLFVKLQEKVSHTARRLNFDEQVPYTKNNERGIVLAINKRVRSAKLNFLELVITQITTKNPPLMSWVIRKLKDYVKQNEKESGYDSFYQVFDDGFQQWNSSHAASLTVQCSDYLIKEHKEAIESVSKRSTQGAVQPDDKLIRTQESKIRSTETSPTASVPVTSSTDQQGQRLFEDEDCEYILDPIMQTFDYKDERKKLNASLKRPLSEKDFAKTLNSILVKTEDEMLKNILEMIEARFKERWPKAKKPKTLSSLLIERRT